MNDFSKDNFFLSTIYDLYEYKYLKEEYMVEEKKIFLFNKIFLFKNKRKIKMSDFTYEKGLDKVNYLKSNVPTFDKLYDFCTFIRSMEKVYFFKNDIHNIISSDYNLKEITKRNLYINTDNYRITINLELFPDDYNGEVIDVQIFRKYGKKLTNNFKIKDRNVVYNDSDDLMLMNVLNMLLQNIMANTFKKYLDAIYNKEILNLESYDFKEIK